MSATRHAIADLYRAGLSQPEIARHLNLAPTTVSYHVGRLAGSQEASPDDARRGTLPTQAGTRDAVHRLLAEGIPHAEIARRLRITKSTVSYHVRRLGHVIDERCTRRYDWEAVQQYYDEGNSRRDCMKAFGFCSATWASAVRRGAIVARPSATPMPQLLVAGRYRGRNNLKLRLIKEGLKAERCECCGLIDWRGASLSMELHHINGDRLDNRLENLELLCPNCHSQTDTYSGRRGHRRRGPDLLDVTSEGARPQIPARSLERSASSSARSVRSAPELISRRPASMSLDRPTERTPSQRPAWR